MDEISYVQLPDEIHVWAAPVGAPPSDLHPSRLEGWTLIGTLVTDGTDRDGTVAS